MYSYMGHLASAVFFSHDPARSYMIIYNTYFDAAGQETQPENHVITVCGSVATKKRWQACEKAWQSVLDEYGVKEFHAKDFQNSASDSDYADWSLDDPRREPFLRALTGAANKLNRFFLTTVILVNYTRITAKYELAEGTKGAYALSAVGCVAIADEWLDKKKGQKRWVHFVEKGDPGQPEFEGLAKHLGLDVSIIPKRDPQTKIALLPFQVSDLVAYYHRRFYASVVASGFQQPEGETLEMLKRILPIQAMMQDYDALDRFCISLNIPLRHDTKAD